MRESNYQLYHFGVDFGQKSLTLFGQTVNAISGIYKQCKMPEITFGVTNDMIARARPGCPFSIPTKFICFGVFKV